MKLKSHYSILRR